MKPACAACRKSASAQGRKPEDVVCEYDDEVIASRKGPRKSSGEKQTADNNGGSKSVDRPSSSTSNNGISRKPSPQTSKSNPSEAQHGQTDEARGT